MAALAVRPEPSPRRRRRPVTGVLIVAIAVIGVVAGALAVSVLPGADGSAALQTDPLGELGPTDTPTPEPTVEPTAEPTAALSSEPATAEPTTEPTTEPTDVPQGEVADLCETFFDVPCGLGAGRYAPSRFGPAFDIELGDGWSNAAHAASSVVLRRDEGLMSFMSGITIVDPDGAAITIRDRARDVIEALVTVDGVASTEPADVRIDRRRGLSVDLSPVNQDRLALFTNGTDSFYLEPSRTTRVVAIDTRDGTVILVIEPGDGFDLRDILDRADPAAGSIRWR